MKFLPVAFLLAAFGTTSFAECPRETEFDSLPPARIAELKERASAYPYGEGVFWKAEKDGSTSYVVGTYHLADPRIDPLMAQIEEVLPEVEQVLVEADTEVQAEFNGRITSDPTIAFIPEGPTLIDLLAPDEWEQVANAAKARNVPPFMAAKYQPWFLSLTLSVPPCVIEQAATGAPAIDRQIESLFVEAGRPVLSLDSAESMLAIFASDPIEDQIEDLRSGLEMGMLSTENDMTTGELYFRQQQRLIWEYTFDKAQQRAGDQLDKLNAMLAEMEQAVLIDRNIAWEPKILEATDKAPTLIAVGALHLFGETGVLPVLERAGFTITRLNVAFP